MAGDRGGALRAHLETWRPYTLWYVGLVGLAGAGVADGRHDGIRLIAAWAAPTAGWIGGHYLGDYFDRRLDAISKPHRPIPSGRLGARAALWCGCACFAVLAVLAVISGPLAVSAAILAGFGIIAYSRWFKARGLAGNLVRGVLGAIALIYGALTVGLAPEGHHASPATVLALAALAAAFWMHDTTSNLVGALRDIEGDRAGGYETLPVRRGARFAVHTVISLYAVAFAAAVAGGALLPKGWFGGYLIWLAAVLAMGAVALAPLLAHRDQMPVLVALRAHAVLVVERVVLAAAVVGLGLGDGWALLLAVPLVALSWWTQSAMRANHELGAREGRKTDSEPATAIGHRISAKDMS